MKVPTQQTPRTQRAAGGTPFIRQGGGMGPASDAGVAQAAMNFGNALGSVGGFLKEQAHQAKRFGVLQNFSAFQTSVDEQLTELKRNANPAQGNFADQATALYSNWEADWLAQVPDEFHDEFATRAAEVKQRVARESLAFQYESTDNYFRTGVKDALDKAKTALDQDGSLENLDMQRAGIDEYIDSTALTEAEKLAMRRAAYGELEKISYKTEVRRGNLELGALGVGSAPGEAVDLLLEFDGSTLENGLDYETNRELIGQRVVEAEQIAVAAIGDVDRWAALPSRARSAIISLVDDLEELPLSVKAAIDSGDLTEVAQAVAEMSDVPNDRREQEAQIILGMQQMPEGMLDADPRFQNIPYEDRLALRADAEREAAAQLVAEQKVAKAQQDAAINDLMVNLLDGNAGQYEIDQAREQGWLLDYDAINRAQKLLEDRDEGLAAVQRMQYMLNNQLTINPGSEDDRKMFNAYIGEEGQMALRNRDTEYVQKVLMPAVRTAGDLPTETVGLLEGMMRSVDPQQALFALDTLSQLEQANESAYHARVKPEMAADVEYWRTVKDYYPPDEVLSAVRGGTTQEERTRVTMLREEARNLINEGEVDLNLIPKIAPNGFMDFSGVGMTPGATAAMSADYRQLFEREYARDGNKTAAEQRAQKALGRIWKETNTGGQRTLMKYPPELVGYETWNGSHDWITEQGRAELGLEEGQTFQLISDEQTRSEFQAWQSGGPRPSYLAVYKDSTGNLRMPMDENGKAQRLFFEITPEMQAEKAEIVARGKAEMDSYAFMQMYNQAAAMSLATGTPIPEELQQRYEELTNATP